MRPSENPYLETMFLSLRLKLLPLVLQIFLRLFCPLLERVQLCGGAFEFLHQLLKAAFRVGLVGLELGIGFLVSLDLAAQQLYSALNAKEPKFSEPVLSPGPAD